MTGQKSGAATTWEGTTRDATLVPIGDLPSTDYQGEVASLDGNLRSGFVSPTEDLVAKPGSSADSWFLLSRLNTSRGQLDVLIHIIHEVPSAGPGFVAVMASVLDSSVGRYRSAEEDIPGDQCSFAIDKCEVITPIASVSGDAQALRFTGTWSQAEFSCDVTVSQAGPMLANAGTGLYPWFGGHTYHYALPTMTTTGTVTLDGETLEVSGNSWLDRQWGTAPRFTLGSRKWLWLGICLDDGTRLSCWDLIEEDRRHSFATIVYAGGAHEVVTLEATGSEPWASPATGQVWPTKWEVAMAEIDSKLTIQADVLDQEFVSPAGSPVGAHYEAAARVTGTMHGRPVNGYGNIELTGAWS